MTFDEWFDDYWNGTGKDSHELRFRMRAAWDAATKAECERICAAIKAEDDHAIQADYMLDSDDCIAVAQGRWVRPIYE